MSLATFFTPRLTARTGPLALTLILVVAVAQAAAQRQPAEKEPSPAPATAIFLIGNSLTWDTVPSRLDGDVQWHVDCGKSLPYIFEHPEAPCVKSSSLWPAALKQKQYDQVTLQIHYGSTLAQDLRVIERWLALQPNAELIIHTGWSRHASRAEEFEANRTPGPTASMTHSTAYADTLLAELRRRHPQREFSRTKCIELLARIAEDTRTGDAPFENVEQLYRDKVHMKLDSGRYLMHNAMRAALGQPRSSKGFEKLDDRLKEYLNRKLDETHTAATPK